MLTLVIIIVVIGIALFLMMRPRRTPETMLTSQPQYASPGYGGFGGAGGMLTGLILGYLLSQHLITPEQHEMWRNMNSDELRETLAGHGILSESQFDMLVDRASAGDLDETYYAAADSLGDVGQDFDAFDDFGGDSFDV
ncbi:hypothetical protein [Sporolituus thermophilus]|uniref:Uncharacterized protein n=1 Tax=Sporolituus thermophilus DSM 23256 TaxID=1123285 RepID=A0A1G7P7F6_9FIRM|nr:hypothetical protein [Sporolituus thermophilus]SDF81549.1 hypothetical protein SAMN05660235_02837 [Sporolituus thermophilus DSM 23256]